MDDAAVVARLMGCQRLLLLHHAHRELGEPVRQFHSRGDAQYPAADYCDVIRVVCHAECSLCQIHVAHVAGAAYQPPEGQSIHPVVIPLELDAVVRLGEARRGVHEGQIHVTTCFAMRQDNGASSHLQRWLEVFMGSTPYRDGDVTVDTTGNAGRSDQIQRNLPEGFDAKDVRLKA